MRFDLPPDAPLPIGHTLLISCPNNGGLVSVHGGRMDVIDHLDTVGLHASPDLFIRAHQTDTKAFLDLFTDSGVRSLVLDGVEDLHDILVHEGRIYAVSTGTNEVLVYDLDGRLLERVTHPGEKDSWHLNCIAPLSAGLAVSAFGTFNKTREWSDGRSAGRGIVFPLGDTALCAPILTGLDQPHTPRFYKGDLYCCDSRNSSLVRIRDGVRETLRIACGFTRGLALCGDTAYVGLSCSRNPGLEQRTRAGLATIDLASFTVRAVVDLPMREIYDIVEVSVARLSSITRYYDGSAISRGSRSLHAFNALHPIAVPPPLAVAQPVESPPGNPTSAALLPPSTVPHRFKVDIAPVGRITSNPFIITGWFLDAQGRAARQIRVRIGPRAVACDRMDRPDLKAHFSAAALDAGFQRVIKTGAGPKLVVIEAETEAGQTVELYRRLLWMRPHRAPTGRSHDYAAWLAEYARVNPPPLPPEAGPLISVLMPVYNPPEHWLRRAIESVRAQTYPRWELCIANDASTDPAIRPLLDAFAALDPRIRIIHRPVNGHISAASNSALNLCTGEFTALLDHDDELIPHALAEMARLLITRPSAGLVYSDEDKIDEEGRRYDPYFKPDWNPDLLLGQNYFCHLSVYRTSLIRELGGFRRGYEGAQDWDLALRAVERLRDDQILHLPKILYHWRAIAGSTALHTDQKNYHLAAAQKALDDAIRRRGWRAEALAVADRWRIRHALPDRPPLISLLVPTRNRVGILRPCIESILRLTTYPHYEVLIIDNGSDEPATLAYLGELAARDPRVRVLRDDGPFNYSALNNRAAREARGELLALVNNDIEPITPDWLDEMVSQALRPGVGAVGAILYYPDDRIQHAGVVLGIAGPKRENGVAGHAYKGFPRGHDGGMGRSRLAQNYSAVTAACLVVRKAIYEQVGGLNATDLPVSFNDVDFCLRVLKAGYRNLWTPFAELYHHESASRGADTSPEKIARAEREAAYMRATWGALLDHDPAYNPNLTLVHEDFSPAWPPRTLS